MKTFSSLLEAIYTYLTPASSLGRLSRAPLNFIPEHSVMPILAGPLRGCRWVKGSSYNSVWLGKYEPERVDCFLSLIRPGHIFWDVGANVGFYCLLAAKASGSSSIIAFEPLSVNNSLLQRNLFLNEVVIQVVATAVGNRDGVAKFDADAPNDQGKLSPAGDIEVPIVKIDTVLSECAVSAPDLIKIDVEGAEMEVLLGAEQTLRSSHPSLIVETHSEHLFDTCWSYLSKLEYQTADCAGAIVATYAND